MGFLMFIHALVCILLATIILMQSGRGGGLTETFASAGESMFGAKTNSVLVKGTGVLAAFFLVTCLSLAFMSAKRDRSLMSGRTFAPHAVPAGTPETTPGAVPTEDHVVTNAAVNTPEPASATNPAQNQAEVPQPPQPVPAANETAPVAK